MFINDDEEGLHADFDAFLNKLCPHDPSLYHHNDTGEENGDAHIKRQLFGREVVVAVTNGKLGMNASFPFKLCFPLTRIFFGSVPLLPRFWALGTGLRSFCFLACVLLICFFGLVSESCDLADFLWRIRHVSFRFP